MVSVKSSLSETLEQSCVVFEFVGVYGMMRNRYYSEIVSCIGHTMSFPW